MKLKLRLYKYHDPELVQIYRLYSVNFEMLTLECLHAFAENRFFRFTFDMSGEYRPAKRVHPLIIHIDPDEDADILELFKMVKDRCLNGFVKTILKWYLSEPMPDVLLKVSGDSLYFNQKLSPVFKSFPVKSYEEKNHRRVRGRKHSPQKNNTIVIPEKQEVHESIPVPEIKTSEKIKKEFIETSTGTETDCFEETLARKPMEPGKTEEEIESSLSLETLGCNNMETEKGPDFDTDELMDMFLSITQS